MYDQTVPDRAGSGDTLFSVCLFLSLSLSRFSRFKEYMSFDLSHLTGAVRLQRCDCYYCHHTAALPPDQCCNILSPCNTLDATHCSDRIERAASCRAPCSVRDLVRLPGFSGGTGGSRGMIFSPLFPGSCLSCFVSSFPVCGRGRFVSFDACVAHDRIGVGCVHRISFCLVGLELELMA